MRELEIDVNSDSLLLRAVVTRAPYQSQSGKSLLRIEDIKRLGDLCFLQLSELRHRGAFSTVAQSFAACSARCVSIKEKETQDFIGVWYKVCQLGIIKQAEITIIRELWHVLGAMLLPLLVDQPASRR